MPSPYAASNMAFVNALRGVLRLGPLYRTEGKERDLGIDMQTETVEA
jgi:hypothetical protein